METGTGKALSVEERRRVVELLNEMEVIEVDGAYALVEDNEENRALLKEAGLSTDLIDMYGTRGDTFCVMAVAFGEGYADRFDGNKLIVFDDCYNIPVDHPHSEVQDIVFYKSGNGFGIYLKNKDGSEVITDLQDEQKSAILGFLGKQ